jgi:peroxisomal membrane protein 2
MKVLTYMPYGVLAALFCKASAFTVSSQIVSRPKATTLKMLDTGVTEALSGAWASYNEALDASPLLVKSATAGVILGAADLAGQKIQGITSGRDKDVDVGRFLRFAFFGFILQAPWNHFYYMALDGALPPTEEPWTSTTAIKTVIDQFIQAPIFTVLIFAFLGFLEGKNAEEIKSQLDDDYVDTMFANCESYWRTRELVFFYPNKTHPLVCVSQGNYGYRPRF